MINASYERIHVDLNTTQHWYTLKLPASTENLL